MKYFVKDWYKSESQAKRIIREYNLYYQSIEKELSEDVKKVLHNRHDTHIIKTYFEKKDYVMELDEHIWGKAYFVFQDAIVSHSNNIKNEYWLYDEVYKIEDKIEIHILFNKSDIIIKCNNAYLRIEQKNYFKELYKKGNPNIELNNNIINAVIDKEMTCGLDALKPWEQLVFSYINIYKHINYYKHNDIDFLMENHYYTYSEEEKKEIYVQLFTAIEKNIINSIEILKRYQDIIKDENLNYIIRRLLGIYNKKNIPIKEKNQLYLQLNKGLQFDFNKTYKRILTCIDEGLIK